MVFDMVCFHFLFGRPCSGIVSLLGHLLYFVFIYLFPHLSKDVNTKCTELMIIFTLGPFVIVKWEIYSCMFQVVHSCIYLGIGIDITLFGEL